MRRLLAFAFIVFHPDAEPQPETSHLYHRTFRRLATRALYGQLDTN